MLRIAETTNPQSGCLDAVSGVGTVMTNTSAETGTLLARSLPTNHLVNQTIQVWLGNMCFPKGHLLDYSGIGIDGQLPSIPGLP